MYTITIHLTPAGSQMLDFIQNLSTPQILLAVAIVAFLFFKNKDWVMEWFKKDTVLDPTDADPDYLDLQALKRLQKRAQSLKCPEFTQGLEVCAQHFFGCPQDKTAPVQVKPMPDTTRTPDTTPIHPA